MRATIHLRETHLPLTSDQCFVGTQSEHAWFQLSYRQIFSLLYISVSWHLTFDFKLFDIQKSLYFNSYYIYIIYNIYIVITFRQILFPKSTSTLIFNFKDLKILNVKSQKSNVCKMEPAGVKVCQSKYRLTSRTIENKETGVFDLFSKSSSYPIILGRDRLQI